VRGCPWIGQVTSCIAGKRSVEGRQVDLGQKRLSSSDDGRERPGEQIGFASVAAELPT
jgi:hypothetical protein